MAMMYLLSSSPPGSIIAESSLRQQQAPHPKKKSSGSISPLEHVALSYTLALLEGLAPLQRSPPALRSTRTLSGGPKGAYHLQNAVEADDHLGNVGSGELS